jgi:uncharacterized radical SAM protein YgiQ
MSRKEADTLGIDRFDVIMVTGDAYLDHPASATALLGRSLWDAGYTVGIIPQPQIKERASFEILGAPRLFFSISGGSMDPMVARYTPALKKRSEDAYSPGGRPSRPDRATLVYTDFIHRVFPGTPIIIGGIEASLRRFAHYDYWSDRIRQSVLADAPADLLVFGMGEKQLITLAGLIAGGYKIGTIRNVQGTCWKIAPKEWAGVKEMISPEIVEIPSFSEVSVHPDLFARSHYLIAREQNPFHSRPVLQRHPKTCIIQNPPAIPLSTREIDHIYDLPYRREAHPSYCEPVPALEPIRFSVTSHRGCYGFCSFCALAMHQGAIIQSRSPESILREVQQIASMPGFKGIISDIGGPSVNMYGDWCAKWEGKGACPDRECVTCSNRISGISRYLDLLDTAETVNGVKHVFIGSGLRYDIIPHERQTMTRICAHVSGHLKVAPEHAVPEVTSLMNKPDVEIFNRFRDLFKLVQKGRAPRQFLIPYLMSGHPGCTLSDMIILAEYLRDNRLYTEQVQDFTPTPMTASTCMYATGIDPDTKNPVYIPKGEEKRIQRAILHWRDPAGYDLIRSGLEKEGRMDLVGEGPKCLIGSKRPYTHSRISGVAQKKGYK